MIIQKPTKYTFSISKITSLADFVEALNACEIGLRPNDFEKLKPFIKEIAE